MDQSLWFLHTLDRAVAKIQMNEYRSFELYYRFSFYLFFNNWSAEDERRLNGQFTFDFTYFRPLASTNMLESTVGARLGEKSGGTPGSDKDIVPMNGTAIESSFISLAAPPPFDVAISNLSECGVITWKLQISVMTYTQCSNVRRRSHRPSVICSTFTAS